MRNTVVTQARAFKLNLGIVLTGAQVTQLTSDIVWLLEKAVTLPDGSSQKVLVPQVYLLPRSCDLNSDGTLIAGRTLLDLSAANVQNLNGRFTSAAVQIATRNDLSNLGGRIEAQDSLTLSAGRDIVIETTTDIGSGQIVKSCFSRTQIDRVAGLYVTSDRLSVVAGRNLMLIAAEVVMSAVARLSWLRSPGRGALSPPAAPQAFGEMLGQLLQQPTPWRRLADEAPRYASEWSDTAMAGRLAGLYCELSGLKSASEGTSTAGVPDISLDAAG